MNLNRAAEGVATTGDDLEITDAVLREPVDAVIGNVPFAKVTPYGPRYNRGRHRTGGSGISGVFESGGQAGWAVPRGVVRSASVVIVGTARGCAGDDYDPSTMRWALVAVLMGCIATTACTSGGEQGSAAATTATSAATTTEHPTTTAALATSTPPTTNDPLVAAGISRAACQGVNDLLLSETSLADGDGALASAGDQAVADGDSTLADAVTRLRDLGRHTPDNSTAIEETVAEILVRCLPAR